MTEEHNDSYKRINEIYKGANRICDENGSFCMHKKTIDDVGVKGFPNFTSMVQWLPRKKNPLNLRDFSIFSCYAKNGICLISC